MKKINSFNVKKWISLGVLSLAIIIPIPLLIFNSLTNTKNIVLGNYQSYMDPYITAPALEAKYGLSYDYFETAEDAKRLLRANTIDISNTTSYEIISLIEEGLIQKLDWNVFNIENPVGTKITNADEALSLFTTAAQAFLTTTVHIDGEDKQVNLLEYGIPYFLQDMNFVYRGAAINSLDKKEDGTSADGTNGVAGIQWADVMSAIVSEERFKPGILPNIVALNDPRTMYSIPRSIQTDQSNINPGVNDGINDLQNTYSIFADTLNQLGSRSITLNSDSNAVLNMVASNQVNGGFMFNGDAVFASMGGDDGIEIAEDDFHCVKPTDTVVALDLLVVNEKLGAEDYVKVHDILKDLVLNGGDFTDVSEESLSYHNFDFVNYTPTLKVIYDYVVTVDNYFDTQWQIDIVEIDNVEDNQKEKPISNLLKSDFNFAWIGFKNSLR